MITKIKRKNEIEVILCDCCHNTLVYDGEPKQSYTVVSKYVPHQYIQHHYCQDCINKGEINFGDCGFTIHIEFDLND